MEPDNPTLKDLYAAQIITLAHVLKASAEKDGHFASFGVYLDKAEQEIRQRSRELLERQQRRS